MSIHKFGPFSIEVTQMRQEIERDKMERIYLPTNLTTEWNIWYHKIHIMTYAMKFEYPNEHLMININLSLRLFYINILPLITDNC
jgi:hypothetical protein